MRVVVHGLLHVDDFAVFGKTESLDWFEGVIQGKMEVMSKGRVERGKTGTRQLLNKIVTVIEEGLGYEADESHGEI